MAVRREKVDLVVSDGFTGRIPLIREAIWHFDAPRDPVWGVPLNSGPGPHVWGGDQA